MAVGGLASVTGSPRNIGAEKCFRFLRWPITASMAGQALHPFPSTSLTVARQVYINMCAKHTGVEACNTRRQSVQFAIEIRNVAFYIIKLMYIYETRASSAGRAGGFNWRTGAGGRDNLRQKYISCRERGKKRVLICRYK